MQSGMKKSAYGRSRSKILSLEPPSLTRLRFSWTMEAFWSKCSPLAELDAIWLKTASGNGQKSKVSLTFKANCVTRLNMTRVSNTKESVSQYSELVVVGFKSFQQLLLKWSNCTPSLDRQPGLLLGLLSNMQDPMERILPVSIHNLREKWQSLTFTLPDSEEQKEKWSKNPLEYQKHCKQIEDELNQRFKFILTGTPEASQALQVCTWDLQDAYTPFSHILTITVLCSTNERQVRWQNRHRGEDHTKNIQCWMPPANSKNFSIV